MSKVQESILMKGLNFGLPPKKLKYEDYMLNFELLFRDIRKLNLDSEKSLFVKNDLKNCAFTSFKNYNQTDHKSENITKDEYLAFLELTKVESIIIQRADKGNVIVIVDKNVYIDKMESILNDKFKFKEVKFTTINGELDFLLEQELDIKKFLNTLHDKDILSDSEFKELTPHGSQPGILYGLCKVHKECVDKSPPFRPILSAIRTPPYGLAKFLVPVLSELTKNNYVCKDSFSFARDVRSQDKKLFMTSFDIDSLFTNLPLDETIDICVDKLFKSKKKIKGFNETQFKTLLQFATKNSFFIFNDKFYIQTDGIAMGSPLGPTLANVFLCHWEEIWLRKCPKKFAPLYYKRYMDDTFLLFNSHDDVKKFHKYIGSRHKSMTFTFETERENTLPFLDVMVSRDPDGFSTSLYRKPTFSGLYSNFASFMPEKYKVSLLLTLLFRGFTLCTDWNKFYSELKTLKSIMGKNGFPRHFVDKCIKLFLDKMSTPKRTVLTVEKRILRICLPFLGRESLRLRGNLLKLAKTYFPTSCKLQVIFSCNNRLGNFFAFKDKIPLNCRSFILYEFSCNKCNLVYYGKTFRHFKVRAFEHLGLSLRTGKQYTFNPKNNNNTAVLNHLHKCNCDASLHDFRIIGSARNDYHLRIKESLIIQRDKPTLNNSVQSIPLTLF